MNTRVSSAAQRRPMPPGFWTIGSMGSPLVIAVTAGISVALGAWTSAIRTDHGVSVRASGDRGVPPVPGGRRNATFFPSSDQTGEVSRDVDGAMNRIGCEAAL